MRVTYSDHAEERMEERKVSKAEARHVLQYGKAAPAEPGSLAKVADVNGRLVKVAYVIEADKTFHVTTVMLPKRAK